MKWMAQPKTKSTHRYTNHEKGLSWFNIPLSLFLWITGSIQRELILTHNPPHHSPLFLSSSHTHTRPDNEAINFWLIIQQAVLLLLCHGLSRLRPPALRLILTHTREITHLAARAAHSFNIIPSLSKGIIETWNTKEREEKNNYHVPVCDGLSLSLPLSLEIQWN